MVTQVQAQELIARYLFGEQTLDQLRDRFAILGQGFDFESGEAELARVFNTVDGLLVGLDIGEITMREFRDALNGLVPPASVEIRTFESAGAVRFDGILRDANVTLLEKAG